MRLKTFNTSMVLVTSALLLSACGGSSNNSDTTSQDTGPVQATRNFAVDESKLPFDASTTASATTDRWYGVMPNGAGYRVEVPENWNGTLVMYAHGYRGEGAELTVDNAPIRDWLIDHGYAWAASSYSKNYYDVRAGVEDTNELAQKFTSIAADNGRTLNPPTQTLIIGISMGGHIAAAAVEQETLSDANHKVYYDGSMPMCGVTGGTYEFDYLLNFTFAAQHVAGLGPNAYPATGFDQTAINDVLWDTVPAYPSTQGVPTAKGIELENIVRQLTGGDRPLFEDGFRGFYYNVVMGTGGRDGTVNGILENNYGSNTGVFYQLDNDPLRSADENAFNNTMLRVDTDPAANAPRSDGLRYIPRVNGQFSVPVLTLHGLGDLYVPFVHEQIYRRRADANGSGPFLVQRAIRESLHCNFTSNEMENGFSDLVNWVNNGVKPVGDDVLDANKVSQSTYGCQFSDVATRPAAQVGDCTP